jgi:hypothetical protein
MVESGFSATENVVFLPEKSSKCPGYSAKTTFFAVFCSIFAEKVEQTRRYKSSVNSSYVFCVSVLFRDGTGSEGCKWLKIGVMRGVFTLVPRVERGKQRIRLLPVPGFRLVYQLPFAIYLQFAALHAEG